MNSVISQSAAESLIFSWDSPRGEKLAITIFLALSFTTRRPQETKLRAVSKAEHVPSYSAFEPTLKNIPPLERDLRIPSCQPPGAVHFARQKTALPITVAKTSVSFSNELQAFGAPILPEPAFVASNEEIPETIR